ncbi:FadR/GntR family transcriptional regulator [Nitrospirillum sp. BR 11163]|uniref:FadR/GntR family transcriptional regulator n=1 Tax=Nitrospirillum sp. BR 11163 TaxID=3104323 RepID=UPI002AFE89F3|nr:FCD domain-containing protein [Nitrospirillum sp. BR 11163]MEA1673215.1 FCD domain-containing protein [Nitrospirillum sp. BR 11163]
MDDLDRLRDLIEATGRTGEQRLPPEPKLGEVLGVSRGKLRTLLKRVEEEGLIWRHVGKGTFIGQRDLSAEAQTPLPISLGDIMEARLVLEPQLAAQAAIHSTAADLQAMDACLAEMSESRSLPLWRRLDERLHRTVAEASHNMLLLLLYDTLRAQGRPSLNSRIDAVYGTAATSATAASDVEHRSLVDAIRAHDPERAENCMHDHLRSVRTKLFGLR